MTLILWAIPLLGPPPARAFTPEAEEVLDILDARIAAAQAGQASRDAFLEALESPESGCADWEDMRFWKRDPDLRAALEEACPDWRAQGASSRRGRSSPALRIAASQSVRPAGDGPADPYLSILGRQSRAGAEAAASGKTLQRRRAWLMGSPATPGWEWGLQAGELDFRSLEPEARSASTAGVSDRARRTPAQPRLDFILGRRSLAGPAFLSGVEGPLEARTPALDGLGLTVGGASRATWEAGALASWNRRSLAGAGPDVPPRRDAAVLSLAGGFHAGFWFAAAQAAQVRLETAGADPITAHLAGASLGPASGRLRLGAAASALWPRGAPWEASQSAPLTTPALTTPGSTTPGRTLTGPTAGGGSPVTGGYLEAVLSEGKPGGYLLEWRQATSGWASPLSSVPAFSRDTVEEALILPGRGEGGLRARTRLELLEAGPTAPLEAFLSAAGEAAWNPEGPMAGDGRLNLTLGRGPWGLEAGTGLRWRRADLPQGGGFRSGSLALGWSQGSWRARATLARRTAGKDRRESWPLDAETARQGRDGGRWKVEIHLPDAAKPAREARLTLRQGWKLGVGMTLSHSLRLPWEDGEPGRELGYAMRLELAAF